MQSFDDKNINVSLNTSIKNKESTSTNRSVTLQRAEHTVPFVLNQMMLQIEERVVCQQQEEEKREETLLLELYCQH